MAEDRILGLDLQAVASWAILLVSTVILVFILYRVLYAPVLKILDERKLRIKKDIEDAKDALEEATSMKAEYTEKLRNIELQSTEMLREATERAKKEEETIISEAKTEAERLKQSSFREIELGKTRAKLEMQNQIIELSTLIASRYVEQKMDEELHNKLLEQSIKELGSATWLD